MTGKSTSLLPTPPSDSSHWGKLYGSARSLAVAEHIQRHQGLTLILTPGMSEAITLGEELQFFLPKQVQLLTFPDWETLPYDPFSPHQDIVSQRIETLYQLPTFDKGALILPVSTLMQRLPPPAFVAGQALIVNKGQLLARDEFREQLIEAGYRSVSQVMEPGEFAVRGALLDLFPTASHTPYRLDFFDDELENIRPFDVETQVSAEAVDQVRLLPAHEFPFNEQSIALFRRQFREQLDSGTRNCSVYQSVSNQMLPSGIEYYQPLFFEQMSTLATYLPKKICVLMQSGCEAAIEQHWAEIAERYEQLRHDPERPLLPPERLFLPVQETQELLQTLPCIELNDYEYPEGSGRHNFPTQSPSRYPMNPRAEHPLQALHDFLGGAPGRVLFTAESPGRREALMSMLLANRIKPKPVDNWQAFLKSDAPLAITVASVHQGLKLAGGPHIIDETQLLKERVRQVRRRKQDRRNADAIVANLTDLRIGSPVVHIDNGVGRYMGLKTLDIGGITTEFLTIHYAGEDKLYVPVASLHLISRYTGADEETAPLHRLGAEQWQKAKRKAAEQARDVAAELLEIYARRAARKGHAFSLDGLAYEAFSEAFPFVETPDQKNAIESVVADMHATQPMDRVVCGDVGFGKTEVAMRAAFVAAHSGKQVAVLVPTTLLAQQHHQNFVDRFADWPLRIESLSRFGGKKHQDKVINDLAEGKVDIVIGTHKLLQKDVKYANLGLIIVDEEHRFGVRHKEHLKSLRAEVDILTLTATPIPRTLNMSLAGIRDLSIIATPPAQRHTIKTFVSEWNDGLIKEACQRELSRGGQVYFLHNEVKSIERISRQIEELMPHAKVRFAHGQMRESQLEEVMLDFYHQRFNILVCTTIVESGIDVPSANTIIINRADKLGLAQLHQLRGRVGRSHHRAYAYLIAPPKQALTADAQKRLDAIESLEDLGAGFTLATHDMEIRGAGELLGDDQSGQIQQIGFTLYSELLDRAVKALKNGELPDIEAPLNESVEVDLHLPALLPDDFVPDVHTRLILYKRIASAKSAQELWDLQVEIIDRFGLLPEASKTLMATTELKLRAEDLGLSKIDVYASGGRVVFSPNTKVEPISVIQLVQSNNQVYRFEGQDVLRFSADLSAVEQRIAFVETLLDTLQKGCAKQ